MEKKKSKIKVLAVAIALALVLVVVGTFAWFTSEDQKKNRFASPVAGNTVKIVEDFVPPVNWQPGQVITKKVAVKNVGEYDTFVRVTFEEILDLLINGGKALNIDEGADISDKLARLFPYKLFGNAGTPVSPQKNLKLNGTQYTLMFEKDSDNIDSIFWADASGNAFVANAKSVATVNGSVVVDAPTMPYIHEEYNRVVGKWTDMDTNTGLSKALVDINGKEANVKLVSDNGKMLSAKLVNLSTSGKPEEKTWSFNEKDGYFYYIGILKPGERTELIMESVTLDSNAGEAYAMLKLDIDVVAHGIQVAKETPNSWLKGSAVSIDNALKALAR